MHEFNLTAPAPAETTALSKPPSPDSKALLIALVTLAEARQAAVNERGLQVYAKRLEHAAIEDVRTACRVIADTPRREGETAFPELATVVLEVQRAELRRQHNWEPCEECKAIGEGWVLVMKTDAKGRPYRAGVARCSCWVAWKAARAKVSA